MTRNFRNLQRASGMNAVNAEYIDQLYEAFKASPDNVSPEWRHYFYGFEHGADAKAPNLAEQQPSNCIRGRSVRFDVYVHRRLV